MQKSFKLPQQDSSLPFSSPFITRVKQKYPYFLERLQSQPLIFPGIFPGIPSDPCWGDELAPWLDYFEQHDRWLQNHYELANDVHDLERGIRILRHGLLAYLGICEINGQLTVQQSARVLSMLAKYCLTKVHHWHWQNMLKNEGSPMQKWVSTDDGSAC